MKMNTSTIATILSTAALGLMKSSGSKSLQWSYEKRADRFKGKNYSPRSLSAIYKLSQKKRDSIKWLEIHSLFDIWEEVVTPERTYYKEIEPEFDANIFNMFPNLEALVILESYITSIPPEIGNLTKLEYLRILCDDLLELPAEIGNLTNLKYLDISWCDKLISLPPEIGNLTKLEEIEKPSRHFLNIYKTPPLILPKEIVHVPAFTGPNKFTDGKWGHSAWGNMLAFPKRETLRYWALHMHPINFRILYEDLLAAAPASQLRRF
jgi:hypothetical protein